MESHHFQKNNLADLKSLIFHKIYDHIRRIQLQVDKRDNLSTFPSFSDPTIKSLLFLLQGPDNPLTHFPLGLKLMTQLDLTFNLLLK